MINVLQNHASNAELTKKSCIILKQLLKESDDSQLASRMVESQCAEALQLMIETPPEKDDETKQLVLEILNYLFAVKGVLHKIVAKHGNGILKMFMNTDKPDMARAVIECLQHTASEGLEELENEALAKMNLLVKAHQNDIKVCQSGSEYIKSLFENSNPAKIKECAITPRDIIRSFGPYNMDDKIFRNLDVAIDQMGTDEEFYNVLGDLLKNPTSDDFWIMSHLVDRASLDIEGKKDQINQIIKLADSKDLVKSLNSEVCFFLKELKRARPELAKELMKDKSSLIKKIMDEIDHISGPYKFIGLKVLQENIEAHGDFMRENDIIKKAEAWMKQCDSPEDMKQILDFMGAFCDDKVLKSDMIKANLHKQAIEKCQKNFSGNSPTFVALYSYLDKCIDGEEAINDFCESGSMEQTLTMAASMVDTIEDLEGFMSFSTKVLSKPNAAKKLSGSFESVTKLFCTLFEKRVVDFFNKWFNDRSKKEVWATTYRPNFLESIVTEKERDSLRKSFATYEMSTLAGRLHSIGLGERGMDTVTELAQLMATLVCFIAKDDPESITTLDNRELIDNSVQSLKNNIEFINEKNLKSHIIGRYMAMFCVLLPLFHQRAYVKKIANKKSEFCYLEFVQFAELGCTRQPIMVFYTMAAYGLYIIPNNLKPERPQIAPEDEEERKEAAAYKEAPWTPLTFILSDNPVSNSIVDILGKWLKKKADPIMPFVGYLSLALVYQFGTQDSDLIIQSQLVDSLIAMINDETLETFLATSAIYSMDCWCDCSEKSIMKLNSLGSYDKLLRFMNNLRNQDILKVVISSLLQKLANFTDGNQLEYDLERLVKKCKDYDDNCIARGDEIREDALSAYNELSGLLHISKAQQYCLNKNLQSITLNTLAAELRRELNDMVSRGLIVNYQDIVAKLLETNLLLFQNAKSKPDDHKNVTGVLQNVLGKWRSDPVMLKNTLELVKCCAKKKGQLELNAQQSKEMFEDLKSLKAQYKNDQELADKIDSVIELLDLETEKEIEQEAPVIIEPPVDPVEETKEEQKRYDHNVGEHTEQLQEEEQEQKELLEGFVTEGIFAEAQETFKKEEEKIVPEEEEKLEETLLDEHDIKETAPETPETQEEELNLREANDRNRLYNALSKKVEDPSDTSQDEFIAKGQKKVNELEFDELALAIFYSKWVTKATSIPETTPHVGMPARKLKANLDKFTGHAELLKYTCSASASSSKANQILLNDIMESDLITSERLYLSTAQPNDITSFVFFGKTVKNCANSEDNKILISQKGVIKVFINTLHSLKTESEGVLKAVLQAVNAICSSKASCPINTEVDTMLMFRRLSLSIS